MLQGIKQTLLVVVGSLLLAGVSHAYLNPPTSITDPLTGYVNSYDNFEDSVYNTFNLGDDGGYGFDGWQTMESGQIPTTTSSFAIENNQSLLAGPHASTDWAVGRPIEDARIVENGVFFVAAQFQDPFGFGAGINDFYGFSLSTNPNPTTGAGDFYANSSVAFGLSDASPTSQLTIRVGGDEFYLPMGGFGGDGLVNDTFWFYAGFDTRGTTANFTLLVENITAGTTARWSGSLASSDTIRTIGVANFTHNEFVGLKFDEMGIMIPEPTTLLFGLVGGAVIYAAHRRKRTPGSPAE